MWLAVRDWSGREGLLLDQLTLAVQMADAVLAHVARGHDARVRGHGLARGGDRALEENRSCGQGVDLRTALELEAVRRQVIGAQRVDGDQQDVGGRVGSRAAGDEQPERSEERHR